MVTVGSIFGGRGMWIWYLDIKVVKNKYKFLFIRDPLYLRPSIYETK